MDGGEQDFRMRRAVIEFEDGERVVALRYELLADGSVLLVNTADDWSAVLRDAAAAEARFVGILGDLLTGMYGGAYDPGTGVWRPEE